MNSGAEKHQLAAQRWFAVIIFTEFLF